MTNISAEHGEWLASQDMTPKEFYRLRNQPPDDGEDIPEVADEDLPSPYNRVAVIYAFDPDIREHALDRWEKLRAMRDELKDENAVGMSIRIVSGGFPLGDLAPSADED